MPSITEAFRKAFGWVGGYRHDDGTDATPQLGIAGEGVNYDEVLAQLQIVKDEIDRAKLKLHEEIMNYQERLRNAIRAKDQEGIIISASELALKKKVYKSVATYSNLLALAIERVKDTRSLEGLARTIASISYAMNHMGEYLGSITPEVSSSLLSAIESTESMIRKVGLLGTVIAENKSVAQLDPEAKQLIAEAAREAAEETEKVAPSLPESFEPSVLENRLLEYIKANGGVVKISKAAEALGVPVEVVKELLARLEAKGAIKVEPLRAQRLGA